MPDPIPGDSRVQRQAEPLMLAWLSKKLGVRLEPRQFAFGPQSRVEVDGVSDDPPVLVEAWAHQGPPKSAQKTKVTNDAFKLLATADLLDNKPRLILLFADTEAARPFQRGTWRAAALKGTGIEVLVAELPEDVREQIRRAQERQFR